MERVIACGFSATALGDEALACLRGGSDGFRLRFAPQDWTNLAPTPLDGATMLAEIHFGQPDPVALPGCRARWIHLTSAGYSRYEAPAVRAALATGRIALTTSSAVYAEPCAEHLLAMMLALARRLPESLRDQGTRAWEDTERRLTSSVLVGQSALVLGWGAIARRWAELVAPLRMDVVALRRQPRGDETVPVLTEDALDAVLGRVDHVVNTLPGNAATERFLDARRLALLKPTARIYNVGRGTTVDQDALARALVAGQLAGAYLDVTDPEPLPAAHPLWSAPGCYITPHAAGGRTTERLELVRHFVDNLRRYEAGEPLRDRVR